MNQSESRNHSRLKALYDAIAKRPAPKDEPPMEEWEDISDEVKNLFSDAIDEAFPVSETPAPQWMDGGAPPNDDAQQVLVYVKDYGYGTDVYRFGPDGDAWESFGEDVIAWMPFPAAPVEANRQGEAK